MIARKGLVVALGLLAIVATATAYAGNQGPVIAVRTMDRLTGAMAFDGSTGHAFVLQSGTGNTSDVAMLDAANGAVVRTVDVRGQARSLAVAGIARRLFVTADDLAAATSYVSVLDTKTGATLLTTVVNGDAEIGAIDERAERVYVLCHAYIAVPTPPTRATSSNAGLVALDARTGRPLYAVDTHGEPTGVVLDRGAGRLLVVARNGARGHALVLDSASGRVLRETLLSFAPQSLIADGATQRAFTLDLYGHRVAALNLRSGALVRIMPTGGPPVMMAFDTRTGRLFVMEEVIARGATRVIVEVFDAVSGHMQHSIAVGQGDPDFATTGYTLAIDAAHGRVVAADTGTIILDSGGAGQAKGDGSLSVLDARDGQLVRRVGIAGEPIAVAIEPGSGRVYVATAPPATSHGMPTVLVSALATLGHLLPFLPHASPPEPQSAMVILDATTQRRFVLAGTPGGRYH